jgi:hypothetical protein
MKDNTISDSHDCFVRIIMQRKSDRLLESLPDVAFAGMTWPV